VSARPEFRNAERPGQADWHADEEIADLVRLAESLQPRATPYRPLLNDLIAETKAQAAATSSPIDRERISETFGRRLRQRWLEACAYAASSSYRSPPTNETTKTPTGRRIDFGYERDLQPVHLEERCKAFFDPPPSGWSADHILLSSGQSAIAAVLHALDGSPLGGERRPLSVVHFGSYFETGEILGLFKRDPRPGQIARDARRPRTRRS
jgi:hypothetical protein